MYANEQLGPCLNVLVRYSLLSSSEIILKQLSALGSVNIVELSPRLRRIIVKYKSKSRQKTFVQQLCGTV